MKERFIRRKERSTASSELAKLAAKRNSADMAVHITQDEIVEISEFEATSAAKLGATLATYLTEKYAYQTRIFMMLENYGKVADNVRKTTRLLDAVEAAQTGRYHLIRIALFDYLYEYAVESERSEEIVNDISLSYYETLGKMVEAIPFRSEPFEIPAPAWQDERFNPEMTPKESEVLYPHFVSKPGI